MSSDDYMLIRKVDGRFGVTKESASDDQAVGFGQRARWFGTAEDALRYASSEYTEYGIDYEEESA